MLHLSTTEIIACYGEKKGYFCPTIVLPFYKEAVIILSDCGLLIKNNAYLVDNHANPLKNVWNCDIMQTKEKNSDTYRKRYCCRCSKTL